MSRHRNKKHHKKTDQQKPRVTISHSADRRCIAGCPPQGLARPKNRSYRPTAR